MYNCILINISTRIMRRLRIMRIREPPAFGLQAPCSPSYLSSSFLPFSMEVPRFNYTNRCVSVRFLCQCVVPELVCIPGISVWVPSSMPPWNLAAFLTSLPIQIYYPSTTSLPASCSFADCFSFKNLAISTIFVYSDTCPNQCNCLFSRVSVQGFTPAPLLFSYF